MIGWDKNYGNFQSKNNAIGMEKWVAEMARIAKPGVPVIIEQVSVPYCDDQLSSNDKIKWIF